MKTASKTQLPDHKRVLPLHDVAVEPLDDETRAPDEGDPHPAEDAEAFRQQGSRAQPRTDDLGRFVSATQTPFPVPAKYRGGLEKEIDTRDPKSWKNKRP